MVSRPELAHVAGARCFMTSQPGRAIRPIEEFAEIVAGVAKASKVDAVVCVTESGGLFRALRSRLREVSLVAATPSHDTYCALVDEGSDVVRLPVRVPDRFREAKHAIAVAIHAGKLHTGDLVQCVIGQGLFGASGDFIVLTDVEESAARVPLCELIRITDSIRPSVLDATLELACKIGKAARRGKRLGAVFMLGDSERVLQGARQLVPNPLHGHTEQRRRVTDLASHELLIELAKLDGAFVIGDDGAIVTCSTFLDPGRESIERREGLGARHVAAAAVTARTNAVAVAVSATDGNVRVFSQGAIVMQIDPDAPAA